MSSSTPRTSPKVSGGSNAKKPRLSGNTPPKRNSNSPLSSSSSSSSPMVTPAQFTIHHQVTHLHFGYHDGINNAASETTASDPYNNDDDTDCRWSGYGTSCLYLTADHPVDELAVHLRGSCTVDDVKVETCRGNADDDTTASIVVGVMGEENNAKNTNNVSHADPLLVVLRSATPRSTTRPFHADAQSSRGAAGMTTALRAASLASNMGELRVKVPNATTAAKRRMTAAAATVAWRADLDRHTHPSSAEEEGTVYQQLASILNERAGERQSERLDRVARRLAEASGVEEDASSTPPPQTSSNNRAYKLTVVYRITALDNDNASSHDLPGLHARTGLSPHLYTSAGVYGDHEGGGRGYQPVLDSAAVRHRASHQWSLTVTARADRGLSGVGPGPGTTATILHEAALVDNDGSRGMIDNDDDGNDDDGDNDVALIRTLGSTRGRRAARWAAQAHTHGPHVIPVGSSATSSEVVRLESIWATTVWSSHLWTPVSCRALGFAVGPFRVLEDPEYFGPRAFGKEEQEGESDNGNDDNNDDDDDMDGDREPFADKLAAYLDNARSNGEGIRQYYFAPLFERKYIHTNPHAGTGTAAGVSTAITNNKTVINLLPNITWRLPPRTAQQQTILENLDRTVTCATSGVPHRALSLMRDVLALPTYRTASHTQVWIPHAVHGGCTSGALHWNPEVLVNPFLGGAIMDSRLLPPPPSSTTANVGGARLPFHQGGRVLQMLQARCAIRGWITAALPIGGHDDVGSGYLFSVIESFLMSLYERGHGGQGEGGAKGGYFFSKRYSSVCGLNSTNLDFLPVQNIEELDVLIGGVGAVPVEERHNEQLWRGANNGSESHTSSMDEFNARQFLSKDATEALERGTDRDKGVPSPSMGWFGSYLSLSFLSSNATSSSDLGCGAVDLVHPVGGLVYRALKSDVFRGVVEGRAGVANFIRLIRAAFIAAHLGDIGEIELRISRRGKKVDSVSKDSSEKVEELSPASMQPFVVCVNELLKKKGLTHTLFTRALQNISGRIKEPQLLGTLVDAERHAEDPRTRRPFVDPEGFPNSYVRAASSLLCKVGVQVETAKDSSQGNSVAKGIQMQAYAEPVIPDGGVAFGGPITIRVVENEGSFREYVKDLATDGSRRDWGATFLHAKPVTTSKAQTDASGTIEGSVSAKDLSKSQRSKLNTLNTPVTSNAFTASDFHSGGYQAIELIRLTNLTPLLWVRVDPVGLYGGRISVFQPDACLAEQLFHDGDAAAQIDALRALAERPLRIQTPGKVTTVFDVKVSELPVRVIGDCLRGSPALHSSLPHTPVVRSQAALAIAQWQNNKAPSSKDAVGSDNWVGINILIQYFRERFYSNTVVMPTKFSRLSLQKNDVEIRNATATQEGTNANSQPSYDSTYQYLDSIDEEERRDALKSAEAVEMEEDEEYRVRSSVIRAIACIRARDGLTPPLAIQFLETVLECEDAEMVGNLVYDDENLLVEETFKNMKTRCVLGSKKSREADQKASQTLSYVPSMLVAETLLSLCYVNATPPSITHPTSGNLVQTSRAHPLQQLMKGVRSWLDWELYREKLRFEIDKNFQTGISGNCNDVVAACAIVALSNLAIQIQSTTDTTKSNSTSTKVDPDFKEASSASFYRNLFDQHPHRNDLTRASCAQALACICCAADRFEKDGGQPIGLLTSLEFLLDRIVDTKNSLGLRHTLSLLMMDACTGKVCSMQRVGVIAGRNDLVASVNHFLNGPLGACHGGDNGSAVLMSVSSASFPAASAVNDGARRGMRLLSRAGHPKETVSDQLVVRVALFATRLWRTINGEKTELSTKARHSSNRGQGVCAFDGILRCSLLALWQWIWPRGCFAVLRVQSWNEHATTQKYLDMGAQHVMQISDTEKAAASAEENALSDLDRLVEMERDRQVWRGEMAQKAHGIFKATKSSTPVQDVAAAEKGIGQPLPPIARDAAFKQGGWIASAAQQRRSLALDGGTAVTKLRLKVKSADS